jgi:hypothetical protein
MIADVAPALLPPVVLGGSLVVVADPEAVEVVTVEEGRAEEVDVGGSRAGLKVAGVVVCADVGAVGRGIIVAIANARTRAITAAPTTAVESARRARDEREEGHRTLIKPQEQ